MEINLKELKMPEELKINLVKNFLERAKHRKELEEWEIEKSEKSYWEMQIEDAALHCLTVAGKGVLQAVRPIGQTLI